MAHHDVEDGLAFALRAIAIRDEREAAAEQAATVGSAEAAAPGRGGADSPTVLTVTNQVDWLEGTGFRTVKEASAAVMAGKLHVTAPPLSSDGAAAAGAGVLHGHAPLHALQPVPEESNTGSPIVPLAPSPVSSSASSALVTPAFVLPAAAIAAAADAADASIASFVARASDALDAPLGVEALSPLAEPPTGAAAAADSSGSAAAVAAADDGAVGPLMSSGVFVGGGGGAGGTSAAPHYTSLRYDVSIDGEDLVMPAHFGIIDAGIYRCAFPPPEAYPFLTRIRVKTIINLLDRYPDEYRSYVADRGIAYHHLAVKGNKAHCEEMDRGKVLQALRIMIDSRNHPVLLHCRSGKHRTGALTGCLRMLQHWDMERACDEYVRYCRHKQRSVDKAYIERFDPRTLQPFLPPAEHKPSWLPASATELPSKLEQTTGAPPPAIDIPAALAAHAAKEAAAAAALAAAAAAGGCTAADAGGDSPRPCAAGVPPLRGRACSASPGGDGDDASVPTSPAVVYTQASATSPAAPTPPTAVAPSTTSSAIATSPVPAIAASTPTASNGGTPSSGTPVATPGSGSVGIGGPASNRPTILRGATGKSIFDAPGTAPAAAASTTAAAAASC